MTSHNQNSGEKSPVGDAQIPAASSVNVPALLVLAQAPAASGDSMTIIIAIAVVVLLIAIYAIVKVVKRPKKPEITPPRESTDDDHIPTKNVLDSRIEVDGPVEITDDMSLAEIKRIKSARVTTKSKAVRRETSKDATERAHREHEEAEKAAREAAEQAAEKVKAAAAEEADQVADVTPKADVDADQAAADSEPVEKSDDASEPQAERKIELKKPDFSKLAPKTPAAKGEEGEDSAKPKLAIKIPKPKINVADKAEEKEVAEETTAKPEAEVAPKPEPEAQPKPKVEAKPEPVVESKPAAEPAEAPKTLAQGLAKTRGGFIGRLSGLFSGEQLPADMVDEVEEILFTADIGPRVAQAIMNAVEKGLSGDEKQDPARIWGFIREYCSDLLKSHEAPLLLDDHKPFVMLVVGVNGAGKTTTIGKLASKLTAQGKKVLLVAGDTYRAGAVDQLAVWADRTHIPIHQGDDDADPSSVLFSGIERGVEEDFDVVICDTSGRLQTNVNLMDELAKMARVAGKALDGAPHETMLVLDANTGQNAILQAQKFNEAVEITGISLTKLDGTARGGVILGICDQLEAPMRYIGIGESVEDLRAFEADDFVDALFM
ncbi:signal recognition particle-docking protein FtsY [Bradymonas sediminis]|nr:signal recognition particle-docking protein FtsY [Bradymonas sediminis]TDP72018.1 fused signal recognition particle receptor [Bradymonas sediminis]